MAYLTRTRRDGGLLSRVAQAILAMCLIWIGLAASEAKAQTTYTLDKPFTITDGLKMCDSTGTYCIDIVRDGSNPGAETVTFSATGDGRISNGGTVSQSEHVKLDYSVATVNGNGAPTLPFLFDALTMLGIDSLSPSTWSGGIRDAYTFVEAGTWTALAGPNPAIVDINANRPDDVGSFVLRDVEGNNRTNLIGQFTIPTSLGAPDGNHVLLNMTGTSNGHNATFSFNSGLRSSASLIAFNSGSTFSGMIWGYVPKLSVVIEHREVETTKSFGTPTYLSGGEVLLPVTITMENVGDAALDSLQITDNLAAASNFGTSFKAIEGPVTISVSDDGSAPAAVLPGLAAPAFNGAGRPNLLDGGSGILGPGDSVTVNFTARLDLVARGAPTTFANTAIGSGEGPFGATIQDDSGAASGGPGAPLVFTPVLEPELKIEKFAILPTPLEAGADIVYRIRVENLGPGDAFDVVPTDSGPTFDGVAGAGTLSAIAPAIADIASGGLQDFTITYTLDQADINRLVNAADPTTAIVNTADASGTGPFGDPTSSTPATVTTGMAADPSLLVEKAVMLPAVIEEGAVISYTVTVTNDGNVSITGVAPVDPGPTFNGVSGTNALTAFVPASADLEPGEDQVFTASYTLSQPDLDSTAAALNPLTAISNTASATGTGPGGSTPDVTEDTVATGFAAMAKLAVTKTAMPPVEMKAGEIIQYQITLENTGDVTVTGARPVDSGPSFNGTQGTNSLAAFVPASADLAPGDTQVFTTSYTLSQPDIDALATASYTLNKITNTADATGTAPIPIQTTPASAETGGVLISGLVVTKAVTPPASFAEGEVLTYSFTILNPGDVTVSDVTPVDSGPKFDGTPGTNGLSAFSPASAILGPNDSQVFTATYTLSQADVDAAAAAADPSVAVTNSADASGTLPDGSAVDTVSDTAVTGFSPAPTLGIAKSAQLPATLEAGEEIVFSVTLENTGTVTVSNAAPVDTGPEFDGMAGINSLSTFSPASATLAPGAAQVFTASYELDQVDIDRIAAAANPSTAITNTATTTGTAPDGSAVPVASADVTTGFVPTASLSSAKQVTAPNVWEDGALLSYQVTVTNTGTTTLSAVTATDAGPTFGGVAGSGTTPLAFSPAPVTLAPGAAQVFTTTYALTQSDIDNAAAAADPSASVVNTADATGTAPGALPLTTTPSRAITGFTPMPSLTMLKTAGAPSPAFQIGGTVSYTYLIENSGNVTISDTIVVRDNRIDAVGGSYSCAPAATVDMAPGDTKSCTAQYVITQTDLDIGSVSNNAYVEAGDVTSLIDSATVPVGATPAISITKVLEPSTASFEAEGDTLTYRYTVQNTGGVAIAAPITVTDNKINGGAAFACWTPGNPTLSGDTTQLAPDPLFATTGATNGDSITCTADYTVTQDDVDAGSVENEAVADSVFAGTPLSSPPATVNVTSTPDVGLALTKSVAPANLGDAQPGDVLTYTFEAENTGSVTLNDVVPIDAGPTFGGAAGTGTWTAFTVTSGSDLNGDGRADAVAPDGVATFTATYAVTQDDLNAAAASALADPIENTATATATPPVGALGTVAPVSAAARFAPDASLAVSKTSTMPATIAVGAQISFAVTITNDGNVTVTGVSPLDSGPSFGGTAGTNSLSAFSPAPVTLAPGDSQVFTATYPMSQTDLDNAALSADPASAVENTADATGTPPTGLTLSTTPDTATAGLIPTPSLSVAKSQTLPAVMEPGAEISYSVTITNDGNVSINGVTPDDSGPQFGGAAGTNALSAFAPAPVTLGPGLSQVFTATYELTQEDIDNAAAAGDPAMGISNTASAAGMALGGGAINVTPATVTGGLVPAPAMSLTKSGTLPATIAAGEVITYTVTVSNDGNVTLSNVVPSDPGPTFDGAPGGNTLSAFAPANASIAPGTTQDFVATYELAQSDIDALALAADPATAIANTASATGDAPDGTPVPAAPASATTGFTPAADLTVEKVADTSQLSSPVFAGDDISWTITVINSGNVTVSNISLTDTLTDGNGDPVPGGIPVWKRNSGLSPEGTLAPGETATYEFELDLRQEDIDSGSFNNTATASGTDPAGAAVSDISDDPTDAAAPGADDPTVTAFDLNASMIATKTAVLDDGGDGGPDPGDIITYFYELENNGNVTLLDAVPVEDTATFTGNGPLPTPVYTGGGSDQDGDTMPDGATVTDDLLPGERITFSAEYVLTQADIDQLGVSNQIVGQAATEAAGPVAVMSADGAAPGAGPGGTTTAFSSPGIKATKTSNVSQVDAGGVITYTITIEHVRGGAVAGIDIVDEMPTGVTYVANSAMVDGVRTEPVVTADTLIWGGQAIASGGKITVVFDALVGRDAPDGDVINTAYFQSPATGQIISNIARVIVKKDPVWVFECSDIIGRVFEDRNLNGRLDRGEPGVKGAHVYTVKGVKITTDKHGRYHVPCAEIPRREGSNFLLKLDERSLAKGWHGTSENPRVQRLTKGKMVQFNFGVMKAALVRINVDGRAFEPGSAAPNAALSASIDQMVGKIAKRPSILRITYARNDENKRFARQRLKALDARIREAWRGTGTYHLIIRKDQTTAR